MAAGGVSDGSSSAGSGKGICFRGLSGIGIDVAAVDVIEGAAGATGVGFGTGSVGPAASGVGPAVGGVAPAVGGVAPAAGGILPAAGIGTGVVAAAVPVCGITEPVPGLTAAPGIAGGVETSGVPDFVGVEAAGAAPEVVCGGVVVVVVPNGNGCEFEIAFVF